MLFMVLKGEGEGGRGRSELAEYLQPTNSKCDPPGDGDRLNKEQRKMRFAEYLVRNHFLRN